MGEAHGYENLGTLWVERYETTYAAESLPTAMRVLSDRSNRIIPIISIIYIAQWHQIGAIERRWLGSASPTCRLLVVISACFNTAQHIHKDVNGETLRIR